MFNVHINVRHAYTAILTLATNEKLLWVFATSGLPRSE